MILIVLYYGLDIYTFSNSEFPVSTTIFLEWNLGNDDLDLGQSSVEEDKKDLINLEVNHDTITTETLELSIPNEYKV